MERYVQWLINAGRQDFDVVRRENGQTILVGNYPTLERARVAAAEDRATVLADPMATEFRKLEIFSRRYVPGTLSSAPLPVDTRSDLR